MGIQPFLPMSLARFTLTLEELRGKIRFFKSLIFLQYNLFFGEFNIFSCNSTFSCLWSGLPWRARRDKLLKVLDQQQAYVVGVYQKKQHLLIEGGGRTKQLSVNKCFELYVPQMILFEF